MNSSIVICVLMAVAVSLTSAAPKPGLFYVPAASSDTQVVRDALGNQQTSYAYQDGHSSAVAVSRSDVTKHLVYQPAPVQVVYQHAPAYYSAVHHAPLVYSHEAPAYIY